MILSASGGPFRATPIEHLSFVTANDIANDPSWLSASKISVDSATMLNKAFEVAEAHCLFGLPFDRISALVHPESTVHSVVEFTDGHQRAALSPMDMRYSIHHALLFPSRRSFSTIATSRIEPLRSLSFYPIDKKRYPTYWLALDALIHGGTYPTALCGADDAATTLFLHNRLRFIDIPCLITEVLDRHDSCLSPKEEDIIDAYAWSKHAALSIAAKRYH